MYSLSPRVIIMLKKLAGSLVAIALFASPLLVSAQSTTDNSALIAQLTALVATLTKELQQLLAARSQSVSQVNTNSSSTAQTTSTSANSSSSAASIQALRLAQTTVAGTSSVSSSSQSVQPNSDSGGVTITAAIQPSASIAPEDSIIPFTSFWIKNSSSVPVSITSFTIGRTGASDGVNPVFWEVEIKDDTGAMMGAAASGLVWDSNNTTVLKGSFSLFPGQTRTYTIYGGMSTELSAHNGQIINLSLVGVGTNTTLNGTLPITGANITINSTNNACFLPQAPTGGYDCLRG